METFEERSLKLKVSQHKDQERKSELQSDLDKVCLSNCSGVYIRSILCLHMEHPLTM